MDKKGPEKKAQLLAALDKGMVMIHLDARRPGVLVPPALRNESHLRLNLSYRFDPPDLTVGEWGVRCTLSFSGSRFKVAVPWSALYAITSHVTMEIWEYPDDMPAEIIQQTMVTSKVPMPLPVADKPAERPRAVLREVGRQEEPSEPVVAAPAAAPAKTPAPVPAPAKTPAPVAAPAKTPAPVVVPAPSPVQAEGPKDEPPGPRRGHLRLVK